jgi:predicted Zn finger-like uncharacterized protein
MIIQCERCNRKFKIDDSMIKPAGNRVRCSKCGNMFYVEGREEISRKEISSEQGEEDNYSAFVKAEENLEAASTPHKETDEKIELKQESITQEVKEITHESFEPSDESEIDAKKAPITDAINWEDFVSITRAKSEEEPDLKAETQGQPEKGENSTEFNWSKLAIDHELEESLAEAELPKLFDETPEEANRETNRSESMGNKLETETQTNSAPNILTVDDEKLFFRQRDIQRAPSHTSGYSPMEIKPGRASGVAGRIIRKLTYVVATLIILLIIVGAGMVILANQGLIPQETVSRVAETISSELPVRFFEDPRRDVKVSDLLGRWISTRNGPIYVVSGNITNQSEYIVNFVRVESEFTSGGKSLFKQVVYAGNTFTENELETLPTEAMVQKLNRRNGDINFDDPKKLAGLNFGIEPGESVPFFTIFPSESRILGVKYNINVVGLEKIQ